MNGAGNDFVVIDARKTPVSLSLEQIRQLSSRDNAITKGCDQLLILRKSDKADVFMQIYNADGGEVDACGNATRCIANMLYKELGKLPVTIQTNAAVLQGVKKQDDYILVDMGEPKFDWKDIPLSMPIDKATKKVEEFSGLKNPIFVSMGNPHVVFFVEDLSSLPNNERVAEIGTKIENFTEVFPQRINVSFAILNYYGSNLVITAKTWERGAGLTDACGTGACAMLASANKINRNFHESTVLFENSKQSVYVKVENNEHILLGGAVEKEFEGTVEI